MNQAAVGKQESASTKEGAKSTNYLLESLQSSPAVGLALTTTVTTITFAVMFALGVFTVKSLNDCGLTLSCPLELSATVLTVIIGIAVFLILKEGVCAPAVTALTHVTLAAFFIGALFITAIF